MAAYFLDSSAATKLYAQEVGTSRLIDLADPRNQHDLLVTRITPVEIAAALFRRIRGGSLTVGEASASLVMLRENLRRTFRVIEVSAPVAELAIEMAERHGLRGYDCVQLAAALLVQRQRSATGLSALVLVSADEELNVAALAEGLAVENPNTHT